MRVGTVGGYLISCQLVIKWDVNDNLKWVYGLKIHECLFCALLLSGTITFSATLLNILRIHRFWWAKKNLAGGLASRLIILELETFMSVRPQGKCLQFFPHDIIKKLWNLIQVFMTFSAWFTVHNSYEKKGEQQEANKTTYAHCKSLKNEGKARIKHVKETTYCAMNQSFSLFCWMGLKYQI